MNTHWSAYAACATAIIAAACSPGPEEATTRDPLVNEQPGGIAERAFYRYDVDPMATLRSYATVTTRSKSSSPWPGTMCSGTMIGPNVMLSAAHCHGDEKTVTFRAYVDQNTQRTETYDCEYLIQTWPETDIALHWCFPNDGVNPGDRWGYVDLDIDVSSSGALLYDTSRQRLAEGRSLYSVWWNPISSIGGDHHIYSHGQITDTGTAFWGNPGGDVCDQSDDDAIGIRSNVWGRSGASGSSQLSPITHRILVGPLSLASSSPDGGPSRTASSIVDLLKRARVVTPWYGPSCPQNGGLEPQLNLLALWRLWADGIEFDPSANYAKYEGYLDANGDGIFDIQRDLESSAGEAQRDWYDLGFDSHRRNALWDRHDGTKIVVLRNTGYASIDTRSSGSTGWRKRLSHPRLNLDPAARYRVQYSVWSQQATQVAACIAGAGCGIHPLTAGESAVFVDELDGGTNLDLWVKGRVYSRIRDVTITRVGATMSFDSHDQRGLWYVPTSRGSFASLAFVTPNGVRSGAQVDWAGIVRPSSSVSHTLASRRLAIPNGNIRACFTHSRLSGAGTGTVHFRNIAGSDHSFTPVSGAWVRECTPWVTVSDGNTILELGASGTSYAVDEVSIERTTRIFSPSSDRTRG